jgi:Ca-activated chloride channel homolog
MKEILEQHAERLTPDERRAIWEKVSGARAGDARVSPRWALPAMATAAALIAVSALVFVQRQQTLGLVPAPSGPVAPPARLEAPESGRPATVESPGAPAGTDRIAHATRADALDRLVRREARRAEVALGAVRDVARPIPRLGGNAGHGEQRVVKQLGSVEVVAERLIVNTRMSSTTQSISAERLRELPVTNLSTIVEAKAGVVPQGGELHLRGGRSSATVLQVNGGSSSPAPPPVVPTTGGTKLPNDEPYDSMFFKNYGVNPFIATDEDALSTFAVDVDAASYTVTRRYLELGHLPPADAVRVEEFVNFFPQGYPRFETEDFRILIDGAPSPFGRGYHLLRIGIKGREIPDRDRKPAQLTFVIDVSGSMAREDRLGLVKRALGLLVGQLRGGDRVGIVVYGTQGRVLLDPVAVGGPGRERILAAIDGLGPEGSTNAEDGLRLGYEMARRGYRPDAINRIVLCSDGVANVGRTGPESILARVRTEAERGVHLTTIGFGMGNYNDVLMEQLADRGDGNHYYVDDLEEARRVLVEHLTGTLQTIAKDAKVQVEFDSTQVLRYRLLGFENRDVADRDFRNDKVDAGEIGAGHEVTALYEVKLAPGAGPGTLATVRLRYARPEQEGAGAPRVREIEQRFAAAALERRFEDAAPHFRLDAAVAEFAEILRGSYWARESRLSDALSVARSAARSLRDDASSELVALVEKAAGLSGRSKPGERVEER